MPAAAVIPAPVAYIKVVAVKKLVVGFLAWCARPAADKAAPAILPESAPALHWVGHAIWIVYFEKIRVFKAGLRF